MTWVIAFSEPGAGNCWEATEAVGESEGTEEAGARRRPETCGGAGGDEQGVSRAAMWFPSSLLGTVADSDDAVGPDLSEQVWRLVQC